MNSGTAENFRAVAVRARPYIGLLLLAVIVLWVLKEGYPIEKVGFTFISSALLVAIASNFANALVINEISRIHSGRMDYLSSLHITALGAFANAAGGLPIGTAIKYMLLHKKGKLSVAQITSGLIVFTVSISLTLLLYVAVLIRWLDIHDTYRNLAALALIVSLMVLTVAVFSMKFFSGMRRHFSPFFGRQVLFRVSAISIVVTLGFILSFWVVTTQLFPQITFVQSTFTVSLGSLVSQMAFLQSIGGIQELSIGVASRVAGTELIEGVMLGLTLRMMTLVSSGLIVSVFAMRSWKNPGQSAKRSSNATK